MAPKQDKKTLLVGLASTPRSVCCIPRSIGVRTLAGGAERSPGWGFGEGQSLAESGPKSKPLYVFCVCVFGGGVSCTSLWCPVL